MTKIHEQEEETGKSGMPVKRNIKMKLMATEPSGYPIAKLKQQMTDLGLCCEQTTESQLELYKESVMRDFPEGSRQAFYICKGKNEKNITRQELLADSGGKLSEVDYLRRLGLETEDVNGSWIIEDDAGGYRTELCTIIYDNNFDRLENDYPSDFPGSKAERSEVINEPTGSAIRDSFSTIALSVCETVQSGIAKADLESIVSTIIGENTSENPKDYEQDNVLYSYLINGYDPVTQTAIAVGVLGVSYRIHIKDYNDKSDHKDGRHNDAEIKAVARFVSYSDDKIIERDVKRLESDHLVFRGYNDIPVPAKKIEVYESKPAANGETFKTGLPIIAPGSHADTMIFFCPDFENIGYIDNTESDVSTGYSRSVTVGFSNSSEIAISTETSMEIDFTIAKFGFKLGVSMAMTNEWNESKEETISFEVGAGKEAYLYQGKLRSIILRYDPITRSYTYVNNSQNEFLSDAVKTTRVPIAKK